MVAVLRELKKRDEAVEMRFWCDYKFAPQARGIVRRFDEHIPVQTILSGKLRRYHNLSLWRQLLRPVTIVLPNIRDIFLVVCGFVQSTIMLMLWWPDVIFTKGGFVCLPVGLAARVLKIPLVIHDSDAHPGLTSRILAKWATKIATGAPLSNYAYPKDISTYVGIPIDERFTVLDDGERRLSKEKLGVSPEKPLIVITGGGLGARRINNIVARSLDELLNIGSLILISGSGQYDELRATTPQDRVDYQLHGFVDEKMSLMINAADIVIARAGATTILELAASGRPTVLIPNRYLTGGHQLKNAAAYAKDGAVEVINEHDLDEHPQLLIDVISALVSNPSRLRQMSKEFHEYAKPYAAVDMADIILSAVK